MNIFILVTVKHLITPPPPVSQTLISKIIVVLWESAFSPIYHEFEPFFSDHPWTGRIFRHTSVRSRRGSKNYDAILFTTLLPRFCSKLPRVTTKLYDLDRLSRFLTTMDYDAQRFTATYADRSESTTSVKSFFRITPRFRTLGI